MFFVVAYLAVNAKSSRDWMIPSYANCRDSLIDSDKQQLRLLGGRYWYYRVRVQSIINK